jgi:hypothetical protein
MAQFELRDVAHDDRRKDVRPVAAEDGKQYSVVSYALDDGDGRIRMVVAVDDGDWSAFVPVVREEIRNSDGTFVG